MTITATAPTGHPADCLCVPCMMADMDATIEANGLDASRYEAQITTTAERTRYAKPGQRCGRGRVRLVSPRQVAFIKNLLRTRDTRNLVRLPGSEDIEKMSLRGARDLIDRLLACPEIPEKVAQANLATPKQVAFALSLSVEKLGLDTEQAKTAEATLQKLTKREISAKIDQLKALPAPARKAESAPVASDLPEVPEGRYALVIDGITKFYVVDRPTEGRWAGWVFLSALASDDKWPIKNRQHKAEILAKIAEDAEEAMLRYGREIGRCGHCNRTLTDETSRALGIGPVCRSKVRF